MSSKHCSLEAYGLCDTATTAAVHAVHARRQWVAYGSGSCVAIVHGPALSIVFDGVSIGGPTALPPSEVPSLTARAARGARARWGVPWQRLTDVFVDQRGGPGVGEPVVALAWCDAEVTTTPGAAADVLAGRPATERTFATAGSGRLAVAGARGSVALFSPGVVPSARRGGGGGASAAERELHERCWWTPIEVLRTPGAQRITSIDWMRGGEYLACAGASLVLWRAVTVSPLSYECVEVAPADDDDGATTTTTTMSCEFSADGRLLAAFTQLSRVVNVWFGLSLDDKRNGAEASDDARRAPPAFSFACLPHPCGVVSASWSPLVLGGGGVDTPSSSSADAASSAEMEGGASFAGAVEIVPNAILTLGQDNLVRVWREVEGAEDIDFYLGATLRTSSSLSPLSTKSVLAACWLRHVPRAEAAEVHVRSACALYSERQAVVFERGHGHRRDLRPARAASHNPAKVSRQWIAMVQQKEETPLFTVWSVEGLSRRRNCALSATLWGRQAMPLPIFSRLSSSSNSAVELQCLCNLADPNLNAVVVSAQRCALSAGTASEVMWARVTWDLNAPLSSRSSSQPFVRTGTVALPLAAVGNGVHHPIGGALATFERSGVALAVADGGVALQRWAISAGGTGVSTALVDLSNVVGADRAAAARAVLVSAVDADDLGAVAAVAMHDGSVNLVRPTKGAGGGAADFSEWQIALTVRPPDESWSSGASITAVDTLILVPSPAKRTLRVVLVGCQGQRVWMWTVHLAANAEERPSAVSSCAWWGARESQTPRRRATCAAAIPVGSLPRVERTNETPAFVTGHADGSVALWSCAAEVATNLGTSSSPTYTVSRTRPAMRFVLCSSDSNGRVLRSPIACVVPSPFSLIAVRSEDTVIGVWGAGAALERGISKLECDGILHEPKRRRGGAETLPSLRSSAVVQWIDGGDQPMLAVLDETALRVWGRGGNPDADDSLGSARSWRPLWQRRHASLGAASGTTASPCLGMAWFESGGIYAFVGHSSFIVPSWLWLRVSSGHVAPANKNRQLLPKIPSPLLLHSSTMLWTMLQQNHVGLVYSALKHIAPKLARAAAMQKEKEANGSRTFVNLLDQDIGVDVNIPLLSLLDGISESNAKRRNSDELDISQLVRDVETSSFEAFVAAGVCPRVESTTSAGSFDERKALLVFLRVFQSIFESSTESTDFDEGGLRFLIAARRFQKARALIRDNAAVAPRRDGTEEPDDELVDLPGRNDLTFAGRMNAVRTSDCAWALHQGGNEQLLDRLFPPSQDLVASRTSAPLSWPGLRRLGAMLWLQNTAAIRKLGERLGRVQFRRYGATDPFECALIYASLGKLTVLQGMFSRSKQKQVAGFLAKDFRVAKNRAAASKNAMALLKKKRVRDAAVFFIIAGRPVDAAAVLIQHFGDVQLALLVCHLCATPSAGGGSMCPDAPAEVWRTHIIPFAQRSGDPWLESIALWQLQRHIEALRVLLGAASKSTDILTVSALSTLVQCEGLDEAPARGKRRTQASRLESDSMLRRSIPATTRLAPSANKLAKQMLTHAALRPLAVLLKVAAATAAASDAFVKPKAAPAAGGMGGIFASYGAPAAKPKPKPKPAAAAGGIFASYGAPAAKPKPKPKPAAAAGGIFASYGAPAAKSKSKPAAAAGGIFASYGAPVAKPNKLKVAGGGGGIFASYGAPKPATASAAAPAPSAPTQRALLVVTEPEAEEITEALELAKRREFWWFFNNQMPLLAFAARCGCTSASAARSTDGIGAGAGAGAGAAASVKVVDEEDFLCRSATSLMVARMMRTEISLTSASFYRESKVKDGAAARRQSTTIANNEARRHMRAVAKDVDVLRDFIGTRAMTRVGQSIRRVCKMRWAMRGLLLLPSFSDDDASADDATNCGASSIVVRIVAEAASLGAELLWQEAFESSAYRKLQIAQATTMASLCAALEDIAQPISVGGLGSDLDEGSSEFKSMEDTSMIQNGLCSGCVSVLLMLASWWRRDILALVGIFGGGSADYEVPAPSPRLLLQRWLTTSDSIAANVASVKSARNQGDRAATDAEQQRHQRLVQLLVVHALRRRVYMEAISLPQLTEARGQAMHAQADAVLKQLLRSLSHWIASRNDLPLPDTRGDSIRPMVGSEDAVLWDTVGGAEEARVWLRIARNRMRSAGGRVRTASVAIQALKDGASRAREIFHQSNIRLGSLAINAADSRWIAVATSKGLREFNAQSALAFRQRSADGVKLQDDELDSYVLGA